MTWLSFENPFWYTVTCSNAWNCQMNCVILSANNFWPKLLSLKLKKAQEAHPCNRRPHTSKSKCGSPQMSSSSSSCRKSVKAGPPHTCFTALCQLCTSLKYKTFAMTHTLKTTLGSGGSRPDKSLCEMHYIVQRWSPPGYISHKGQRTWDTLPNIVISSKGSKKLCSSLL